jgi:hypothetical protein
MSFDIFLTCFRNGEKSSFPRAVLEKSFGPYVKRRERTRWVLDYGDGGAGDLYVDEDEDPVESFGVNRPAGDRRFWQGIVDVMKETGSVLYWPARICVVADESFVPHVPKDMVKALGQPVVTADIDKILELIRTTE